MRGHDEGSTQLVVNFAKTLKLAQVLRHHFDMQFSQSRPWADLPTEAQTEWLETAQAVMADMRNPRWRE